MQNQTIQKYIQRVNKRRQNQPKEKHHSMLSQCVEITDKNNYQEYQDNFNTFNNYNNFTNYNTFNSFTTFNNYNSFNNFTSYNNNYTNYQENSQKEEEQVQEDWDMDISVTINGNYRDGKNNGEFFCSFDLEDFGMDVDC